MKILSLITYPPCRSKPVKALFVFRTNLRYFGWKPGGLWLSHWLPSNTLSRSRKVWNTSPGYSICHQWFNRNVMKRREYFLGTVTSPLCQRSAIWRLSPGRKMRPLFCISPAATRVCCLHSNQSVNRRRRRIPVSRLIQRSVRILSRDNFQNGAKLTQRRCLRA